MSMDTLEADGIVCPSKSVGGKIAIEMNVEHESVIWLDDVV